MRIGTWNVEYARGTEKNRRRHELMREVGADLWVLTETHDDLRISEDHHPVHSEPRPAARTGERWVSIWSRYRMVERVEVTDPERTVAAIFDSPMGLLLVYGTVLPWHTDRGSHPADAVVPNWSEHYRVIEQKAREWSQLRRLYPSTQICVAGDLNMNLGGQHYYGTEEGRKMLRMALLASDLVCTTTAERIPEKMLRYSPIDHIVLSSSLAKRTRVTNAWEGTTADGTRLSDHSALVVEIDA